MKDRPNILLITSDQHRADALGVSGHRIVQTPNLDQLAYEGVIFNRAYSDCPVCIPARTTIITGRRAHTNGIPRYAEHDRVQRHREDFLGSLITAAGYQTQLIGKTHWHCEPSFRAGFENVTWQALMRKQHVMKGKPAGVTGLGFNGFSTILTPTEPEETLTGWSVERAVEFMQLRDRTQPFFLWLSLQDPHPPFMAPEPYFSQYDGLDPEPVSSDWSQDETCPRTHYLQQMGMKTHLLSKEQMDKSRSVYYGMITFMDHQLGRLIGTMQYQGDWDNTIVIYTSDHGEFLGDHGAGKKNSFCECSARVPFIIRFPQTWRDRPEIAERLGTRSNALVELSDLLPTICELAGARIPHDVDGQSLLPLFSESEFHRDHIHGHIDDSHMFRDINYKYLYYTDDGSEQLFLADDSDDRLPVAQRGSWGAKGDLELLDRYRQLLTNHLKKENHEHWISGELLNKHLPKPSEREALVNTQIGHGALGWSEFQLNGLQGLN
jgi:arylsulfatase